MPRADTSQQSVSFHALPIGAIQPKGWLQQQLTDDLLHGFVGHLDLLTEHASRDLFRNRIESSSEQYAWWDAETRGNWLWGYTLMAFLADHPDHKKRVSAILHDLKNTQDADGYIGIYSPQSRYQHGNGENGELWGQSRALLPMLTYYELTGDVTFLESVERAVQLTMEHYGSGHSYYQATGDPLANLVGVTHGLCYVDVLEWLYRITGNVRYRDFGVWLYDDFCQLPIPFPNDDLSTRSLADKYRPLSGHAVHTAEHLRVLAWAYSVTKRTDLADAYQQAIHKLSMYMLPSGTLIGDEGLHGMPLPDTGYEFCTTTELMLSLASTLQKLGGTHTASQLEKLLFNAGQGARLANGTAIAYLSQDTRMDASANRPDSYSFFHQLGGRFKFSPTHEDIACCCNPNSTRLLPHYINHMWMQLANGSGLAALLYGASQVSTEIDGVKVQIEEITDYPFADDILFHVMPTHPVRFRLYLRKPEWAQKVNIAIHSSSSEYNITEEAESILIDKLWLAGDQVRVNFEVNVRTVAYLNGEYAVFRGALQYVLPINPHFHSIKTYPDSPLHDVEIVPDDMHVAYRPFVLEPIQPDFGLHFETIKDADLHRPWHTPPVQLTFAEETLVPMGCAMLRRASFPINHVKRQDIIT